MSSSAFAVGSVAVLSIGLLVLLALNTALAKGSFRAHELRVMKSDLAQREQLLRTRIEAASSPVALTQRAADLGLVPATAPIFLRLSDGSILGERYAAGLPLDPETGAPVTGETVTPVDGSAVDGSVVDGSVVDGSVVVDPNTVGQPRATAPAPPTETETAVETGTAVETETVPGVATTPGTDTEQPLGLTDR
jgi:hypothetical protein